jgi:hypothetical protein
MTDKEIPLAVKNGLRSKGHERLDALVGDWKVEKSIYIMTGTPDQPVVSTDILCHRQWIVETGQRHMLDICRGTLAGTAYYRLGVFAYSTMDQRYEWNTVDAFNATMMTYKGDTNSANAASIVMEGQFTDQGVLGDGYVGKEIHQRVVIEIESNNHHIVSLYFTPPGEEERLTDKGIYTRYN